MCHRQRARAGALTEPPAVSYSTDLFLCALGAAVVALSHYPELSVPLSLSCPGGAIVIANVEKKEKRSAGDRVGLLEPVGEY